MTTLSTALDNASQQLKSSHDLEQVFTAFMDIAESSELRAKNRPYHGKPIKKTIKDIVKQAFNAQAQQFTLMQVKEFGLYHGSFFINLDMAVVFYLEQTKQGIIAVDEGNGQVKYIRLSNVGSAKNKIIAPPSANIH